MRSNAKSTLWLTLFFALLGLAWCGYMAFPTATPPPCATSGCALFRDTKFAGLSLWAVGGAYFFLLAVICLRGNRHLARFLAFLALLFDALLLLIMYLTAPCFDCLVAAIFIGLCYITLRNGGDGWFQEKTGPSVLLPIWFGLFLGNAMLAGNEMLPMHSIDGKEKSDVRIFFSPSCPSCREALLAFGDKATLYPVLEGAGDLSSIIKLETYLAAKMPMSEALSRSLDPAQTVPELSFVASLVLDLQLLRNKAALMRQGFRALPLIQINGMPGHKATSLERPTITKKEPDQAPAPKDVTPPVNPDVPAPAPADKDTALMPPQDLPVEAQTGNSPDLPDFLDAGGLQKCGGDSPEPCE
ncbi:hypothetical protein LJB82_01710 [Desulfovibrio sp. OttesenSCG-928-M16]|nr:hypothetical protein [Desulfovibrio sp. OttesenSCG-928-M16]